MAKFSTIEDVPYGLKTADFIFRNQEPIAQRLAHWLPKSSSRVLEVASGWGQHACYWSWRLTELGLQQCFWQPTECRERLSDIFSWYQYANTDVMNSPIEYQIGHSCNNNRTKKDSQAAVLFNQPWDGILAANFCHYVNNATVIALFSEACQFLSDGGHLYIYGPINFAGGYTSEGNKNLDIWLRQRQWDSGIKDIKELENFAKIGGMRLIANEIMPANNHWLVFKKR